MRKRKSLSITFNWQNRLILGLITVLGWIQEDWGVNTRAARNELNDVRRRLRLAYERRKGKE